MSETTGTPGRGQVTDDLQRTIAELRRDLAALHADVRKLRDEIHRMFDMLGIRLPEEEQ